MRRVLLHPDARSSILRINEERETQLKYMLQAGLGTAYAARDPQDMNWAECLRQYEAVPKDPIRNFPFENAPNYEVTLGAIASDALYAQAIDLIFNQVSPLAIAMPTRDDRLLAQSVKDFQTWINIMSRTEFDIRNAFEQTALDWEQLGTGVCLASWFHREKKTYVNKIVDVGAVCTTHPVEDLIVPAGATDDLQWLPWLALRYCYNEGELAVRARPPKEGGYGWDIDGLVPIGNASNYTRLRREQLGRAGATDVENVKRYEVHDVYCHYDIDGDGLDEDLLVSYDRNANHIALLRYAPYDLRNVIVARYQKRGHLFYALGVLEMMAGYQQELTDLHNDTAANSRLANLRMFKSRPNAIPGGVVHVHQGRVVEVPNPEEFGELVISDVYPSAYRNEAAIIAYAERRVGVRELSGPSPSKVIGGRTPGITALSVLQQVNQRFAPAFDDLRRAIGAAIFQCAWRYREQLLGGRDKKRAAQNIFDVLGASAGQRVIDLLMSPRFEDSVNVEITATSANFNKTQERQDAMLLIQVTGQYYQKAVELMMLGSNPQVPDPVKKVAAQIAEKMGEIVDRTIRTFDTVRDPSTFLIDMNEAIDAIEAPKSGLEGLAGILQQIAGGQMQGGGANGAAGRPQMLPIGQ